jgi:hypothetical protein
MFGVSQEKKGEREKMNDEKKERKKNFVSFTSFE